MKKAVVGAAAALVVAAAVAWGFSSPAAVGVSKVKGNPGQYVGKLKMIGMAGRADANFGLLEVADEKACCTLVLEVPVTAEQQAKLKSANRYAGALPAAGTPLEVLGTLRQEGGGYALDVSSVSSGGKVILRRI